MYISVVCHVSPPPPFPLSPPMFPSPYLFPCTSRERQPNCRIVSTLPFWFSTLLSYYSPPCFTGDRSDDILVASNCLEINSWQLCSPPMYKHTKSASRKDHGVNRVQVQKPNNLLPVFSPNPSRSVNRFIFLCSAYSLLNAEPQTDKISCMFIIPSRHPVVVCPSCVNLRFKIKRVWSNSCFNKKLVKL